MTGCALLIFCLCRQLSLSTWHCVVGWVCTLLISEPARKPCKVLEESLSNWSCSSSIFCRVSQHSTNTAAPWMHSADSSSAEKTFRASFSEMCQQAWRELARRSFRKSFRFPDNASHNWFPGHMHKYGLKIMFSSPLWNTGAWDPCREKSGTLIVFWRSVPRSFCSFAWASF